MDFYEIPREEEKSYLNIFSVIIFGYYQYILFPLYYIIATIRYYYMHLLS